MNEGKLNKNAHCKFNHPYQIYSYIIPHWYQRDLVLGILWTLKSIHVQVPFIKGCPLLKPIYLLCVLYITHTIIYITSSN